MEKHEIDHLKKVREMAPECMVLLKSDGSFPLDAPGKLALFGEGAGLTLKGGTGSGDVYTRAYLSIEEALEQAGFSITSKAWLKAYRELTEGAVKAFNDRIKAELEAEGMVAFSRGVLNEVMPKPVYDFPLEGEGDTAVYVLSRVSGEGKDRKPEKGDIYLTDIEVRDILRLNQKYSRFLLVLNVGGVVDLSPVVGEVKNILLLSQLGSAVGEAFADVLLGKSYPSGKLSDTWASWEDYCPFAEFGEEDDTRYREGIYVGYRYFDAVGKTPLFPFGYGLCYTDFSVEIGAVRAEESRIFLNAKVKNTGKREGKEIIQLYVSKPWGKLSKPRLDLAAFCKTRCLQPGETEELTLSFDMRELASFDESTHSDILEKGTYLLRLGNSSRNTFEAAVVELLEDVTVRTLHDACGTADFTDWEPEKDACGTTTLTDWAPEKRQSDPERNIPVLTLKASDIKAYSVDNPNPSARSLKLAHEMRDEDLALFCTGAYNGAVGSNSVIGNAGITVAGSAGETISIFKEKGIPSLVMADGPAGLRLSTKFGIDEKGAYSIENRLFDDLVAKMPDAMARQFHFIPDLSDRGGTVYERYCTAIPIGTALAQSWNPEVWESAGSLVAEEMQLMGIQLWLAPAMNLHRLPLCGRNFEYYSEDPLLTGKAAAGIVRGVQRHKGCGVVVKHFACNNQETNRTHSNTIISKRALREMYLRGFEIAIRESEPAMLMSSYNLLNGIHTSESRDLLETILREEWGFRGSVMSDWVCDEADLPHKYRGASASASVAAGNDIMMPGLQKFYDDILKARTEADAEHPISREVLEISAARMIDTAFRLAGCD